tara:strand:+ start:235 stop:375 length:141 start_codon:yes stop_codon:yes gene_type:complete
MQGLHSTVEIPRIAENLSGAIICISISHGIVPWGALGTALGNPYDL